jgi:PcfJ-like protein
MPNPRAQKPLSFDQIIKDAKSLGVPAQALLDALAGGVKGSVSATVGAPADIYNLLNQASFRGQLPTMPYGSEDISKMLPDVTPTQDKSRQHSAEYGENMGSFIPTPMAGQALKGAVKLGAKGARALGEGLGQLAPSGSGPQTLASQVGAIKLKGGNWFANEVENKLKGLKQKTPAGNDSTEMLRQMRERYTPEAMANMQEGSRANILENFAQLEKDDALNNWVDKNLTNYIKKEMGTPEDPVRLMIDRRVEEINKKHKEDMARANRVAQRAIEETDPRRQANLQREANRLKAEANSDLELSLKHTYHFPFESNSFNPNEINSIEKIRKKEGFPAEGMGKSDQAKAYETNIDLFIDPKKVGEIQALPARLAEANLAELERSKAKINLDAKVNEHLEKTYPSLSNQQINDLVIRMGIDEKESMVGDNAYSNANAKAHSLRSSDDNVNLRRLKEDPDINKIAPEANIYSVQTYPLMFEHILDVLKEDLANGRLKPEDLKNISVEQAVRKTADYDKEMARKMAEAQFKITEGMPVHKEYPEGYKWIELTAPKKELPSGWSVKEALNPMGGKQFQVFDENGSPIVGAYGRTEKSALNSATKQLGRPELEKALQYEGETMGHCVGGYCPDVLERRSRIFSLRDTKGEPHVTVEVKPNQHLDYNTWFDRQPEEIQNRIAQRRLEDRNHDIYEGPEYLADRESQPPKIVQIKGKQNLAPKEQYLPFVQDFVKSGNWSDVGDLKNTGLNKIGNQYLTSEELKPKTQEALNYLNTHPAFEPHRQANREYLDALDKEFSTNEPVYTRHEMNELERRYSQILHPEVRYTLNEMKAGLSNPEEYDVDSLGRRLADIEKLREIHGDVPQVPPVEGMKRGGAVNISNNPDTMFMELMDKKMKEGGAEADTKLTPSQWLEAQGNKPIEPFTPIEDLTANLKGLATLPSRMYEGAKLLVNDPKAYFADMKAPTAEELAMAFNPSHIGMLGATKGIPVKFDRAPALTKAEINAMAERMAPQVMGEFVRAKPTASQPNPSTSVSGKSRKQFESEKDLGLKTRDLSPPVTPSEFDYTDPANKGKLLIGTSGDVTPTGKEILEIKGVPIEPVEQQGGPEYGLRNKGIWAASNDQAQAYQNQAKRASEAHGGAEPLLHYHRMTDEANLYAMHHLHTLLNYLKPEELAKIDPSKYGQLVKLIQEKDVGFGLHPEFGGFTDPLSLTLHAQIDPDFRRHLGKILQMPSTAKNFGLRNGLDVLASTSEPELRNLEAGSSGFAIAPIDIHTPYVPYTSPNRTYETDILGGEVKRSRHPVPYELSYRDATKYLVDNPPEKGSNNVFGRLNFTKPRQIIDQQFQDEVGQYMDAMKRLTGKKKGGAISNNPDTMFMELNDKKFKRK